MDGLPTVTTQTFIGILVAITGNILISLALNLQKLAHKRVETLKKALNNGKQHRHSETNGYDDLSENRASEGPSLDEHDEDRELLDNRRRAQMDASLGSPSEIQPLIVFPESQFIQNYGNDSSPGHSAITKPSEVKRTTTSRLLPTRFLSKKVASGRSYNPDDNIFEGVTQQIPPTHKIPDVKSNVHYQNSKEGNESDYLKSRLWFTTNKIFQFD